MLKNISMPKYIRKGIKHNHHSFPVRYRLFGADTETVKGKPYTFQVSSDGIRADLVFVNEENILDKFLEYMAPKVDCGRINIMYIHNLQFDLGVLFYQRQKDWLNSGKLQFEYKGHEIDFVIKKVFFGKIRFPGEKRVLTVLDSRAFFVNYGKSSLSFLADELNLPVKKLPSMPDVGETYYEPGTPDYTKFIDYSKQDAIVEWHLGAWIVEQYRKFDTRVCVSSPQFSMRVFKHYFIRENDTLKFPPTQAVEGSVLSYHGGKNGYYVEKDGVTIVKDCTELDVVSMYPFAMKNIPNFLRGDYVFMNSWSPEHDGVWRVRGRVKKCLYPVLFRHDFTPVYGSFEGLWFTSYEIKEALAKGELEIEKAFGWVWVPEAGLERNPFHDFVDRFFKEKSEAPTKPERVLAKLVLNSLYGKLIQTVESEKGLDDAEFYFDAERDIIVHNKCDRFTAGGMFNPFIASLITGYARAYLHRIEHDYKALHSSTDSIKTVMPYVESRELGGLKKEITGDCYMFRNKLYLHYDNADNKLKKFALHGFQGRPEELLKMFNEKRNNYQTRRMLKVREAMRQGKQALMMMTLDKELKGINFKKINYIPEKMV